VIYHLSHSPGPFWVLVYFSGRVPQCFCLGLASDWILLPLRPGIWDYRHVTPCLVTLILLILKKRDRRLVHLSFHMAACSPDESLIPSVPSIRVSFCLLLDLKVTSGRIELSTSPSPTHQGAPASLPFFCTRCFHQKTRDYPSGWQTWLLCPLT
jgi:hypothetical protein